MKNDILIDIPKNLKSCKLNGNEKHQSSISAHHCKFWLLCLSYTRWCALLEAISLEVNNYWKQLKNRSKKNSMNLMTNITMKMNGKSLKIILHTKKVKNIILSQKVKNIILSQKVKNIILSQKVKNIILSQKVKNIILSQKVKNIILSLKKKKVKNIHLSLKNHRKNIGKNTPNIMKISNMRKKKRINNQKKVKKSSSMVKKDLIPKKNILQRKDLKNITKNKS